MEEELSKQDYYSMFIKRAITDLKRDGICYVFNIQQADEIKKHMKVPVHTTRNECGFTLNIPRNKRNYRKEI